MRARRVIAALAVVLGLVWVSASLSGDTGVVITDAESGEKWPFTVAEGELRCEPPSSVVFKADDVDYAVNGMARAEYRDIAPIWRDNPATKDFGLKVDIGPIIKRGLALCDA